MDQNQVRWIICPVPESQSQRNVWKSCNKRDSLWMIVLAQTRTRIPGHSLWPFWDGYVTPSKVKWPPTKRSKGLYESHGNMFWGLWKSAGVYEKLLVTCSRSRWSHIPKLNLTNLTGNRKIFAKTSIGEVILQGSNWHIPPWENWKSSSKITFSGGYLSFREDIVESSWMRTW